MRLAFATAALLLTASPASAQSGVTPTGTPEKPHAVVAGSASAETRKVAASFGARTVVMRAVKPTARIDRHATH